jgi:cytochrome c553
MQRVALPRWSVALCVAQMLAAAPALAEDPALERARKIVSGSCFLCHGTHGESATELYPRLAAQNADYIARQLASFKSGSRRSSVMQPMVQALTPDDMQALGRYFSTQKSEPHPTSDPKLAAQGMLVYRQGGAATEAAACTGCHGERGQGNEILPRLAGQVASYLVAQMRNFASRERAQDGAVMHGIASRMTDDEMRAVAEYLSGLD